MSLFDRIKDGFFKQLGTTAVLVVSGLVAWALSQLAPIVLPAIDKALPNQSFVAILLLSIILNMILVAVVWRLATSRSEFKLIYGILWDKTHNPHCPVCKNGGIQYGTWGYGEVGYYCKKCKAIYSLTDAAGNEKNPSDALSQL